MGKAQKLKKQRREEERRREEEKKRKRKMIFRWSVIGALILAVLGGIIYLIVINLPVYVDQMVIEMDKGEIVIELKEKDAPETCQHIKKLVNYGSYDCTRWYEVVEQAALTGLQGVDPTANAPDPEILRQASELDAQAGTVNDEIALPNIRGAVGMAKPSDPQTGEPLPNSATAEFYILKDDAPYLDPNFTIFGEVVEGMDVVDMIIQGEPIESISIDDENKEMVIDSLSGRIIIQLRDDEAPETVKHIQELVGKGFYDNLNWYRVEDFVIQTGSHARSLEERSKGTTDPNKAIEEQKTVKDEIKLPNVRGAVGVIKRVNPQAVQEGGDPYIPDSAQGEFFILKADLPGAPRFTVFGEVVQGMEVVDEIAQDDPINKIYIRRVNKKS